jgi:hypothetical protein
MLQPQLNQLTAQTVSFIASFSISQLTMREVNAVFAAA